MLQHYKKVAIWAIIISVVLLIIAAVAPFLGLASLSSTSDTSSTLTGTLMPVIGAGIASIILVLIGGLGFLYGCWALAKAKGRENVFWWGIVALLVLSALIKGFFVFAGIIMLLALIFWPDKHPEQTLNEAQMISMQKGTNKTLVYLGIILVVFIVLGVYIFHQITSVVGPTNNLPGNNPLSAIGNQNANTNQPSNNNIAVNSDISTWQTYTDPAGVFLVKYPNGWAPAASNKSTYLVFDYTNPQTKDKSVWTLAVEDASDPHSAANATFNPQFYSIENVTVGGLPAKKYTHDTGGEEVIVINQGKVYAFLSMYISGKGLGPADFPKPPFDQFYGSFKFLK